MYKRQVEGCTAPNYSKDSLHAGVVEIVVKEGAKCRYTTIQNWSDNILNLVTQRAKVFKNGSMEWVDGNIGSAVTMKYPTCMLMEEGAKGSCITIAVARENQIMDSGSKMIHLAPNTSSSIVSKSVSRCEMCIRDSFSSYHTNITTTIFIHNCIKIRTIFYFFK